VGFGVRLLVKMVYGGLEVGSLDEAERCMRRAIELAPARLVHRVVYARVLLKMNKRADAVEQLVRRRRTPAAPRPVGLRQSRSRRCRRQRCRCLCITPEHIAMMAAARKKPRCPCAWRT